MNSDPADTDQIEWPREIWAREKGEHDPVGQHVFSDAATVARFDGDTERDAEFHRYVDGDIYDIAERYWRERLTAAEDRAEKAEREEGKLRRDIAFLHAAVERVERKRDEAREALADLAQRVVTAVDVISDAALRVGLEGTCDWDKVAGGADIFGLQDQARRALRTSEPEGGE